MTGEYRNPVDDSFEKIQNDVKKVYYLLKASMDMEDMEDVQEEVRESIEQLEKLIEKL